MSFTVSLRVECRTCALLIANDIAGRYRGLGSVAVNNTEEPPHRYTALLSQRVTFWPGVDEKCAEHGGVVKGSSEAAR